MGNAKTGADIDGDDNEMATAPDSDPLDRSSRVNFRVGALADTLADRAGSPSAVAKILATRWMVFVDDEIRKIRDAELLNEAELLVMCDALRGIPLEPVTVPLIGEAIRQAAVVRRMGRDRGVDGEALVQKVTGANTAGSIALLDAVERFWDLEDRIPDPTERLKRVGLLPRD